MTEWVNIEPIIIPIQFDLNHKIGSSTIEANHLKVKDKIKYSKGKLESLVRDCIEVQKLSFTDTTITLGVSPTTVRRVLRTLKIGRYSDQIP